MEPSSGYEKLGTVWCLLKGAYKSDHVLPFRVPMLCMSTLNRGLISMPPSLAASLLVVSRQN